MKTLLMKVCGIIITVKNSTVISLWGIIDKHKKNEGLNS